MTPHFRDTGFQREGDRPRVTARSGAGVGPSLGITSSHLLVPLACAFVFIFLVDAFLALRQWEVYFKLYLCLSLVLLSGELDTHLHFAVNVTSTQPVPRGLNVTQISPLLLAPAWGRSVRGA